MTESNSVVSELRKCWDQNRRQKVFNRGSSRLWRGAWHC